MMNSKKNYLKCFYYKLMKIVYLEFNQHSNGLLIFIKKLVQSLIQ
jgi:hypothetical protein